MREREKKNVSIYNQRKRENILIELNVAENTYIHIKNLRKARKIIRFLIYIFLLF